MARSRSPAWEKALFAIRGRYPLRQSIVFVLTALIAAGCGTSFPFPGGSSRPGGADFASAPVLELAADGSAEWVGTITQRKVEVWDLGAMSPGDRIHVEVSSAAGSGVDPAGALFDANQDAFVENDDADASAGDYDTLMDEIVREATGRMYLAITSSYYSSRNGAYQARVVVSRGGAPAGPVAQKIMLNFVGGTNITIPNVGTFDVLPFDAGRIDADYAGMTASVKAGIVARVRQCYAGLNVIVQSSDDPVPIDGPDVSTLYFGEFSRTVFGISQDVDSWNDNYCDDGIIYTDRFDDAFAVKPSPAGIAMAIGNVAAHEAGHLLGLAHVADVTDLMDTTGAASTLLDNQVFKRSLFDESIFPIGYQNGPKQLLLTVGASP